MHRQRNINVEKKKRKEIKKRKRRVQNISHVGRRGKNRTKATCTNDSGEWEESFERMLVKMREC